MADPFDPTKISASRLGKYAECGKAFEFAYIDNAPRGKRGSASLFGTVMHHARAIWVLDREQDFVKLTQDAWMACTEGDVAQQFLADYILLSGQALLTEEAIRDERPDVKKVRSTKDWKESAVAIAIDALVAEWLPRLDKASDYCFTASDPLPRLYDTSLRLADNYALAHQDLPNSLYTEVPFEFDWRGYQLRGYIDEIAPIFGGESIGIVDAKTYALLPEHNAKDWIQLTIYDLAVRHLYGAGVIELPCDPDLLYPDSGARIYHGVDLMRFNQWKWHKYGLDEHRLLFRELQTYSRGIEAKVFIPASKSCRAEFCDFSQHCQHWHGNASKEVMLDGFPAAA